MSTRKNGRGEEKGKRENVDKTPIKPELIAVVLDGSPHQLSALSRRPLKPRLDARPIVLA